MQLFSLEKFDHKKDYVIEASAGTGKTFNITKIVNKLVNEWKEDLNSILIVTYTEKAAGELKDRIKDELKGIDVDNAPIYTIHSFCQKVIKEFVLAVNLPLDLNVIDENEINSFCDKYIREGEILEDISIHKAIFNDFDLEKLKKVLVGACNKYYLDLKGNEDPSIINLDDFSEDYENDEFVQLCDEAESFEQLLEQPLFSKHYNVIKNSGNTRLQELSVIIKENYKNGFTYSKSTYRKNNKMSFEEQEALNYFHKLQSSFKDIKSEQLIAFKYLKDFYQKWQLEKEKRKSQSFDDMIRYVREGILNNPTLKQKLKQKYKRAIIDEFQDTNQRQFDIFESIFMEDDDHKIIVVGDPKQSIYSFQGADINVYYNAVKAIEAKGGIKCMLNKNYRSTEDMVSSCNKLFNYYDFEGTEFNDCGFLSESNGDEKVHKVIYDGKPTQAFWMALSNTNDDLSKGIEFRDFANLAARQIVDCCKIDEAGNTKLQIKPRNSEKYKNVSFKDFAVLARTSSEMIEIEQALKNAGIPYIRYKDKNLFLGTECSQWICLLEAINLIDYTGKNRRKLKKALFTSFFGLTLEEINSSYYDRDDIKEVEILRKWRMYSSLNQWEDLFDDIIMSSNITQRLKSLKEIQSLSIFKQIANYCIEYLSKGKSIDNLIRNLKNLSKGGNFDGDEQNGTIVEKSTNFDCVQIMTIHASKGLQFPVVIGVCGFKKPIANVSVTSFHKDEKQILSYRKTEEYINEQIAEWKRLFYVAYTRAQFVMIMPKYKKYGAEFLEKSITEFVNNYQDSYRIIPNKYVSYQKLREEVSEILKLSNTSKNNNELRTIQDNILKTIIKDSSKKKTYKHSYSSLSHDNELEEETFENKEGNIEEGLTRYDKLSIQIDADYNTDVNPISIASDFPKGAKIGTILHEVFEGLDYQNYNDLLENKIIKCFQKQGVKVKEQWIESVKEIVNSVLNAKLPIVNGNKKINNYLNLKDIPIDNKLDEVEFNFNILNEKLKNYCNGFVDMIFKNDEYYSIVDWKSDSLNDTFISYSNPLDLKQHVNECYSMQRVLYCYCLIKWLKLSYPTSTEQEIFENHFGGIYYIFIKGCNASTGNGIYCQTWASWEDLKTSFNQIIKEKIGGQKNE